MFVESLVSQARREGYPQSLQIKVLRGGKTDFAKSWGPRHRYFDVGSLTKIMVTTPLVMTLWEAHALDLEKTAGYYLGFLEGTRAGKVKVKDLLRHLSGLEWWRPFFNELKKLPWDEREYAMKRRFRREPVGPAKKCVYSDLDFILLGWILESVFGMPLDETAQTFIFEPLGMENTFYIRHGGRSKIRSGTFADTEIHPSRGRLQKVVFDDNAWSMGGVSGHAGLFSTLDDVSRIGREFLNPARLWKPSTLRYFTRRAVKPSQGDWALGFVIPSRPLSSAGTTVSDGAFGHTGYTGTSLWIDPRRHAVVTILSNRTFPTRKDERFLSLRRNLHDAVWERLDGKK